MSKNLQLTEKFKCFCWGVLTVIAIGLLVGAADNSALPNTSRYQIATWSGQLGANAGGVGVFIVDTISGETKTVYTRIYGDPGTSDLIKNDLRKSFASIP